MRSLALLATLLLIWTAGLLSFAWRVDHERPPADPPAADGIVALTGSDQRIDTALQLLEAGAAQRLLISGVSREVTRGQLQILTGAYKPLFDCCVDLGFQAANTVGNAHETAAWAKARGYKTLILVTADYHMPRAGLELGAAMPGVTITPYPVETPALGAGHWWKSEDGAKRMALEYCKYLAVLARETILGLDAKPAHAGRPA